MRITFGLAAMASLCLLAGCNKGAANNSVANATNAVEPAANVTEPEANAAAPATAAGRDNEVAECSADLSRRLPAGTDVPALCGCAVDRIAAGASQREGVTQCATQLNITLPAAMGGGEPAPAGNTAE
jgi:hypothetical protein